MVSAKSRTLKKEDCLTWRQLGKANVGEVLCARRREELQAYKSVRISVCGNEVLVNTGIVLGIDEYRSCLKCKGKVNSINKNMGECGKGSVASLPSHSAAFCLCFYSL